MGNFTKKLSTRRDQSQLTGESYVLFAVLLLACGKLLLSYAQGICGNDFWWHVKVGEWVLEHKEVPTTGIFSWYASALNIPWTAHEWLSDVIFHLVLKFTGQFGVFALSLAAALAMLILLWKEARPYAEKNIAITAMFFFSLAITLPTFFYGRPHLFSFFLVFAELKILFRFSQDKDDKSIYLLPVIAVIWSNLHGGSSNLSYILCMVFLVCEFLPVNIGCIYSKERDRMATGKLAIITVCTAAALLINPIGLKVLIYPYSSLGDGIMMSVISEWQAPDAKSMNVLLFEMIPIALMLLGFFAQQHRIRLIDLAVMAIFMLLYLRSLRFIMLWFIAAPFCAFRYMPKWEIKVIHTKPKSARFFMSLCLAGTVLLCVLSVKAFVPTAKSGEYIEKQMTDEAIAAVKANPSDRLFNDYNLGESLIYEDIPVFVDARADMYIYENILADSVSLFALTQINPEVETPDVDVNALISKYNFDAFLILKTRPLYVFLASHPDKFTCVYEDDSLAYFSLAGS